MPSSTPKDAAATNTCVTFIASDPDIAPTRKLSYTELLEGIGRTANALRSRAGTGQRGGLPAAVTGRDTVRAVGCSHGRFGTAAQPATQGRGDCQSCRASGAKALVATLGPLPGTKMWNKANRVKELAPELGALIQVGGEKAIGDEDVHLLADLLRSSPPQLTFSDRPGLDDVAALFHTGGTTGAELVIHTHRNQLAAAYGGAWAAGASSDDVIVNGLPMFHVASAIFCSLAMFVAGAEVVILSPAGFVSRIVADFWRIVERTGATIVGGVPTALLGCCERRSARRGLGPRADERLRCILACSPCRRTDRAPDRQADAWRLWTPNAVARIRVDPVARQRVIGSAGCAIPFCGIEARALDGTSAPSRRCLPGVPGVLVVRGPNVTPGYKDAAQSASLFTSDGWLIKQY